MTNDTKAPELIVTSKCGKTIVHDGMKRFEGDIEWIPHDLHLSLVAAAYEDAFNALFVVPAASQEQEHMAQRCQASIRSRTPADAQAALEAHANQIRKEAYTQGVKEAARFFREHGDTDVVHALIQKDKTDDIRVGKATNDDLVKRLRKGDTVMANHYMDEAADRIEELEAKLAKTVKRLEKLSRWLDLDDEELANLPIETLAEDHRHIQQQVNAAIAELKGQDL